MASRVISKTVHLVGTWNEDVLTDKIMEDVSHCAKTVKGTKMKLKVSETGLKLSRAKLFQEKQTKFFPINSVQTVKQISDYPRCVMLILSDPYKKYKILAFRCNTKLDGDQLTNALVDIQNKVQSPNIELSKRDNGNWTLRGRTFHNANKHMMQVFNENQQPNGQVAVVKVNDDAEVVPAPARTEVHTNGSNHKEIVHEKVYVKKSKKKGGSNSSSSSSSSDEDDDFVIETEVATRPHTSAVTHADHNKNEVKEVTSRVEGISVKENPEIRNVTRLGQASTMVDYYDSSRHQVYERPLKHNEETILPSKPVVYRATSSHAAAPQPVVISRSSRGHVPIHTPVYYTDPWAHRRISKESSILPMRVGAYNSNTSFDQQSMMSNTSRLSRSHRLRLSEVSIPTTVRRSVEHVYPRPVVILRRGYEHATAYRPRPASYHARPSDLVIYHEDPAEAVMFP